MPRQRETLRQHAQAMHIMGTAGTPCQCPDGTILNWSWPEEAVMQALRTTDVATFLCHCVELNLPRLGYMGLCVYAPPEGHDADGQWWVCPNPAYPACPYQDWRDGAIEEVGSIDITSAGVLLLAARYQKGIPWTA